ncbi:MAG TPA: hypothetical protein VF826_03305 [Chloroflexia bacterium]
MPKRKAVRLATIFLVIALTCIDGSRTPAGYAQEATLADRFFPETGYLVQGRFLEYWESHGALQQFGYPISNEAKEVSQTDGNEYTMQYFERAIFEYHPENQPPYDVLLSLLGRHRYIQYYGPGGPPKQQVSNHNPRYFPETGHTVGGVFRAYWESHGGLAQQGYPITDEFREVSPADNQIRIVQYFERAVFEYHAEHANTPNEVQLAQLGSSRYRSKNARLTFPPPIQQNVSAQDFKSSGSYLLWSEYYAGGSPNQSRSVTIRALDTNTNQVITVAKLAQGGRPAISGSTVLWYEGKPGCPSCSTDIVGKDLITGVQFTVTSEPGDQKFPAVWGRRAAWYEGTYREYGRILVTELGSGKVEVIASASITESWVPDGTTLMNERYLVWTETASPESGLHNSYRLKAYDFDTHRTSTVAEGIHLYYAIPTLSLSGRYLTWNDGALHLADLSSGESSILTESHVSFAFIQGDTIVWPVYTELPDNPDSLASVWGRKLSDGVTRQLYEPARVSLQQGPISIALVGDWLVWNGQVTSTAAAFATSGPPAVAAESLGAGRLITERLPSDFRLAANGKEVFWLSSGTDNRVHGYDTEGQARFLVSDEPGQKFGVEASDKMVAWIEKLRDGNYRIRGYDLSTRQFMTLLDAASPQENFGVVPYLDPDGNVSRLALDGDSLYYVSTQPGHEGLWNRNLATGQEQAVSHSGYSPEAQGGNLVWLEQKLQEDLNYPGLMAIYEYLHLRKAGEQSGDTTIGFYRLSDGRGNVDVAGSYVTWSTRSGAVYLYDIASGQTSTLTKRAQGLLPVHEAFPVTTDRHTAWAQADYSVRPSTRSIVVEDRATGERTSFAFPTRDHLTPRAIVNDQWLVFTAGYLPGTSSKLYIMELP